jgi:hypothetical protein
LLVINSKGDPKKDELFLGSLGYLQDHNRAIFLGVVILFVSFGFLFQKRIFLGFLSAVSLAA